MGIFKCPKTITGEHIWSKFFNNKYLTLGFPGGWMTRCEVCGVVDDMKLERKGVKKK